MWIEVVGGIAGLPSTISFRKYFCPSTVPYSAGQPKPALHPKFSENHDMLNYCQLRKNFKNNSSGNSADNPF